ncbi:hypothetical protein [Paenibacillus hamazuiensis]|uniref:hypothetical protein n=1 Tax=Paenibacillus hamazuiensis TaxID=2936508 RepID=UPI00200F3D17|nr:hypothetical protein [Paenibacillus hamazuiensis]
MPSFLKLNQMTLMDRLAHHVGRDVALEGQDFSSGPGTLQSVGKRFIRVNDQYFVPSSLQEIVLLSETSKRGANVHVHSTYRGAIQAELIRTGIDFLELIIPTTGEEEQDWTLIPLHRIVRMEKA